MTDTLDHIDSENCWCVPDIMQPCPSCLTKLDKDCWHCKGTGMVEKYDPVMQVAIIHKDR